MLVAIPTYERPALLRKAVLPHLRAGVPVRVYDSSELATCNENKTMLRSLERDFRVKIRYVAERELLAYIKQLVKQGVDPKIANYALKGNVGAARNRILLDTYGDRIVMCDDDIVASTKIYGSYDGVLFKKASFGLRASPEAHTNYDSIELAMDRVVDLPAGASAKGMMEHLGGRLESLWKGSDKLVTGTRVRGRVSVIQVGCVGDPPGTTWSEFDTIRGGTSALQTRQGRGWARGVKQLTYQPTGFVRTFYVGLDNRLDLPPFLPSETSSGGLMGESVYGSLLALKRVYTVFLPETVLHLPEGPKARTGHVTLPAEVLLAEAAMSVTSLQELGDLLENADIVWVQDMADKAEKRISGEVEDRKAKLGSGVLKTGQVQPTVVKVKKPGAKQVQDILDFGKLLKAWPSMLEAASILRGNGVSLTVEL